MKASSLCEVFKTGPPVLACDHGEEVLMPRSEPECPAFPLPMDPGSVGGEAPLSLGDQLHFSVVETWISLSDSQTQLLTSLFSGSMSLSRVLDSRAKSIKMVNDPIALGVGFTGIANVCSCLTKRGTGQAVRMSVGGGGDSVPFTFHGSRTWYQMATQ